MNQNIMFSSIINPVGCNTFEQCLDKVANYLVIIGAPIMTIMVLYAAFLYLTSAGSEEKVTRAHKALTYAAVGFGIILISKGITYLVVEVLGG